MIVDSLLQPKPPHSPDILKRHYHVSTEHSKASVVHSSSPQQNVETVSTLVESLLASYFAFGQIKAQLRGNAEAWTCQAVIRKRSGLAPAV